MLRAIAWGAGVVITAAVLGSAPAQAQDAEAKLKALEESVKIIEASNDLIGKGKYEEAMTLLDENKAKVAERDLWVWWGNRGVIFDDHRREFGEALRCYDESVRLDTDGVFRNRRGEMNHLCGNYELARQDFVAGAKGRQPHQRYQMLKTIVEGPFRPEFPKAWRKCELRSRYGNYHIVSSAGTEMSDVRAIEAECQDLDPALKADLAKIERKCKPSKTLTSVATLMELVRKEYMGIVNMKSKDWPKGRVFKVFFFEDTGDYTAFTAKMGSPTTESTLGYYSPSFQYLALYNAPGGDQVFGFTEETLDTFFHEGWHQFYHLLADNPPIWVNEGLAEVMGPSTVQDGGKKIMLAPLQKKARDPKYMSRYDVIKEACANRSFVKFKDFFYIDTPKWHAGNRSLYYAQAWAVCYYALRGPDKNFRIDFLKLFRETTKNRPQKDIIDELFPTPKLELHEKNWLLYMKKL